MFNSDQGTVPTDNLWAIPSLKFTFINQEGPDLNCTTTAMHSTLIILYLHMLSSVTHASFS